MVTLSPSLFQSSASFPPSLLSSSVSFAWSSFFPQLLASSASLSVEVGHGSPSRVIFHPVRVARLLLAAESFPQAEADNSPYIIKTTAASIRTGCARSLESALILYDPIPP